MQNLSQAARITPPQASYLLKEAVLFLVVSYLVLVGGTFHGLVLANVQVANAALAVALGIVWFGSRLIRPRPTLRTPLDIPLLLILAAFLVSSVFSIDPRRSLILFPQLVFPILSYYLVIDLIRSGWPEELFLKIPLLVSGYIIVLGILQVILWYRGWFLIGGWGDPIPPVGMRITAAFWHPNAVAAIMNLVLPIGLVRIFDTTGGKRIAYLLYSAAALLILFLTSSRGGWLATASIFATLILLLAIPRLTALRDWAAKKLRRAAWLLSFSVLGLVGIFVASRLVVWQMNHPTHVPLAGSRGYIWGPAWEAFLQHPLTGTGPFTYGSTFLQSGTVPPAMLLAHAHSLYLNVLTESGIVGAAALLVFLACVAALLFRRARVHPAVTAALVGLAVHSLFDLPELVPAINIVTTVLLAVMVSRPSPPVVRGGVPVRPVLLFVGWVAACGALVWGFLVHEPYSRGMQAALDSDWGEAAGWFDLSTRMDPGLGANWFQAGFAHGMLGLDAAGNVREAREVDLAVQAYRRGLSIEPEYGVNWANLAWLEWASGDRAEAVRGMEQAIARSHRVPEFRLALGKMYEDLNQTDQAWEAYRAAVELAPYLPSSPYFATQPSRLAMVDGWAERNIPFQVVPSSPMLPAWQALAEGDAALAAALFEQHAGTNPGDYYLGMGLARMRAGRLEEAEQLLKTAVFALEPSNWQAVWARQSLAEVYRIQGDLLPAEKLLKEADRMVETATTDGPASAGTDEYLLMIYNRESNMKDLLPGLDGMGNPGVMRTRLDLLENH